MRAMMRCVALLVVLISPSIAKALDVATHRAINEKVGNVQTPDGFSLNSYLISTLDFNDGVNEPILDSSNNKNQKVFFWLSDGGNYEDNPPGTWPPYRRSRNHFHNPLFPLDQAGYTGPLSLCIIGHCPASAVLWAQGHQNSDFYSPGGDWSWKQTRQNFYTALTATVKSDRETNFANTFRGLGQIMHLVQDMSVPEHTRNSFHAFGGYEGWVKANQRSFESTSVFNTALAKPVFFDPSVLPLLPSAFATASVPIANLFDTKQYSGNNPGVTVLNVTSTPTGTTDVLGLAEYTNANFFSKNTINLPGYGLGSVPFPYPNVGSTNLQSILAGNAPLETIIAENGAPDTGLWVAKTGDGEKLDHLAKFGYTTNEMAKIQGSNHTYSITFILDDKCYEDYAKKLLPRAVGYSAGLLKYFFRGALEITIPDIRVFGIADGSQKPYVDATNGNLHQQFTKIRAKVKNTAANSEAIGAGILQAIAKYKIIPNYAPDLSNYPPSKETMTLVKEYSYSVSATVDVTSISSASFADYTFNFEQSPIPAGITDLTLQVVFKGTIGNEADNAIAVGFRDISEPTHMVFWNLTDRFSYGKRCGGYWCYDLYTEDQINNDPVLKADLIAHGANFSPETFLMKFAFKGSEPGPDDPLSPLALASVPAGGHVRLIVLGDGQSSTVNYVQYGEQYDKLWNVFSSAIVLTVPGGSIDATPTTTFRYYGSLENPVPIVQHYDYEIIDCYPPPPGGGCVINEDQEPAANLQPVTVQIMMP